MHLSDLGNRICILGPSNSGKSTLADAIARKHGLPAIHLDQLFHLPHTNWVPRPFEDFAALHDEAILEERWVMDGNYSKVLPQRLARATGLIVLEVSTVISLMRYFRRCLFERDRRGTLEGAPDRVNWGMIRHIAITTPKNRRRYERLFQEVSLPKIRLASACEISRIYDRWGLDR